MSSTSASDIASSKVAARASWTALTILVVGVIGWSLHLASPRTLDALWPGAGDQWPGAGDQWPGASDQHASTSDVSPLDQAAALLLVPPSERQAAGATTTGDIRRDPETLDRAEVLIRRALDDDPTSARARARAHAMLSTVRLVRGDAGGAEREAARAAELDGGHLGVLLLLGSAQFEAGNYPAAEATFRRAVAIDPSSAEAYSNLGKTLFRQGFEDQAVVAFQQADALRLGRQQRPEV